MKKALIKKCFKILAISAMLIQYFQPVAILAERRIVIYENQTGPYYQVDIADNEIVNTTETEENDIVIEETQEIGVVESQEKSSLEISEDTVEPENTEVPVSMAKSAEQKEVLETPVEEETVDPTNTPEVRIELTEESVLDEIIDIIEPPEITEIAPIEFKKILSEFVVETEEGFEFEQALDKYTSVYASTEEEGLKQLVIGENPINAQVNQSFEPISLELNESTASTYSLRSNVGWSNTNNTIQSSYPVDLAEGITFTVRNKSLLLKSMLESAGEPVQQDNQVVYPMEGKVNLRYVI